MPLSQSCWDEELANQTTLDIFYNKSGDDPLHYDGHWVSLAISPITSICESEKGYPKVALK